MDDTSKTLPSNYVKGYCYFDVRDGKFWVDTTNTAAGRVLLNAGKADTLTTSAGSSTMPIYFSEGKPMACGTSLAVSITGNAATANSASQLQAYSAVKEYAKNTLAYFNIDGTAGAAVGVNDTPVAGWWHILRCTHANNSGYYTDLAIPFSANSLYYKRIVSGSLANSGWVKVLDQLNYTDYTVTKTGSGASGTWGINISGNANTANYLNVIASNEIRFNNFNYNTLWINYVQSDGTTNSTACTSYYFGDGQKQYSTVTLHAGQFSGNAASASSIIDSYNGSKITFSYGNSGLSSATWLAAWNGYELRAISPAVTTVNAANTLKINNTANLSSCLQYIQTSEQTPGNDLPTAGWWHVLKMNHGTGDTYYKRLLAFDFFTNSIKTASANGDGVTSAWKQVWIEGNSVTSAVWNDYAEYRESDCQEFGRVLVENGDDSLSVSNFRLQSFAGISSDTWGFCQGETEKAKTPIAVAGRVLAYPYQKRENYKPGDCVCAAPNGTVDIMTRQEIIEYPDRIVGTVSCVPDYEEWGNGDRPAVKVDGRIWIKVK